MSGAPYLPEAEQLQLISSEWHGSKPGWDASTQTVSDGTCSLYAAWRASRTF